MTLKGTVRHQDGRFGFTATAALEPGDVLVRPDGRLAIMDGLYGCAIGDLIDPDPIFPTPVCEFAALSTDTWLAGQTLYWNATDTRLTTTRGANRRVGRAVRAKTSGQTTAYVAVDHEDITAPVNIRVRATIAEVNAGLTLLPAVPGIAYRLIDASMIAIGGAAATATTIDILATQSASSVKLMAAAVAGLTQNTLLRAGAANAAILAGGLSFVTNDVNTALTLGKTGSNVATATHIDVLMTVQRETA